MFRFDILNSRPTRLACGLMFLVFSGCAHPVSEGFRNTVDPNLTFAQLFESPDAHRGKPVVLGGVIVETRNLPDKTEIEVVQKDLDFTGYPELGDDSGGRFIIEKPGYLEPEIFSKGRRIVGAGKVTGSRQGKVGGRDYRFPVVDASELHLLEDLNRLPYFYPPYWYPWHRHHFYSPC